MALPWCTDRELSRHCTSRSATETLEKDDKFFCDSCGCLQEAHKRMKLQQLPPCLIFHLKRFKYVESQGR